MCARLLVSGLALLVLCFGGYAGMTSLFADISFGIPLHALTIKCARLSRAKGRGEATIMKRVNEWQFSLLSQ